LTVYDNLLPKPWFCENRDVLERHGRINSRYQKVMETSAI
jgi:hypothetical protein